MLGLGDVRRAQTFSQAFAEVAENWPSETPSALLCALLLLCLEALLDPVSVALLEMSYHQGLSAVSSELIRIG